MTNEDFNTKLNSRFDSIRDVVLDVLSQLFKQEFSISQTVVGSGNPQDDIKNDTFPKVVIRFTSQTPNPILQVWTLPAELVLSLYGWMIDMDPDTAVSDEHLEGLKEGIDQIIGQIRAVLDGEGVSLAVEDLQLSLADTIDAVDLSAAPSQGAASIFTVEVAGNSFSVNQYLFADLDAMSEAPAEQAMSDEDIEKMLNGDDLDARVSVDSELGEDVDVQQVEFGAFGDNAGNSANGQPRNIDMLLDVDLEVLVELGRKTMLIKDVLKLGKGSVVELDKAAGEPLSIFVNGRKLAEGEVVVVDDHFGIRITQLAGQAERIKSLG